MATTQHQSSTARRKSETASSMKADRDTGSEESGLGFWWHLYPRRGLSDAQAEQWTQALGNYCLERQWLMEGTPLRSFVHAQDGDLEHQDLMDFLAWVAQGGMAVHAELSGLCLYTRPTFADSIAYRISLAMNDPVLQAVNTLYQLHRLSGSMAFVLLRSDLPLGRAVRQILDPDAELGDSKAISN